MSNLKFVFVFWREWGNKGTFFIFKHLEDYDDQLKRSTALVLKSFSLKNTSANKLVYRIVCCTSGCWHIFKNNIYFVRKFFLVYYMSVCNK